MIDKPNFNFMLSGKKQKSNKVCRQLVIVLAAVINTEIVFKNTHITLNFHYRPESERKTMNIFNPTSTDAVL